MTRFQIPVSQAGKLETRVVVLPSAALPPDQETALHTVRHNPAAGHLCELLAYTEEHRTWFVGQKLVADGRLVLATPVHPVLLAMPYLAKAERLVPLDQMLEDQMLEEQMMEEQMLTEQMLEFPLAEELVGPMCRPAWCRWPRARTRPTCKCGSTRARPAGCRTAGTSISESVLVMAPCSLALAPSSPGLEEALQCSNQMLRAQLGPKRLLIKLPLALAVLLDANHLLVLCQPAPGPLPRLSLRRRRGLPRPVPRLLPHLGADTALLQHHPGRLRVPDDPIGAAVPPLPPGSRRGRLSQGRPSQGLGAQRLGIDPLESVGWNDNLCVWLAQTVLRPLITEVDSVNAALPKHRVADYQVAVEWLRKVAGLSAVAQHLPHLEATLPYLEAGPDQPYLLGRLRQLARTGALSLYRWNGGGEGWTERLPSDSELLVHCLASYLTARRQARPGGRGG